ncbi:TetR/AcrR family transcriptional regulator [Rosettibacter firmus]|uniref:TetR/AcrR family transcriptional regulator n=1 Tax=Rosettibacter firmus TaxID=3111522 RepID=UPI00336BC025
MDSKNILSKRDLILSTARDIITKQGYAKTTLEDIANALGMKKSSLYYYYQNKDALLEDVIKNEKEKYIFLITEALSKEEKIVDKLINYEITKSNYVKSVMKLQDLSINIFIELKHKIFKVAKEIRESEVSLLTKVIEESIKKKEIKKCNAAKIAQILPTISEAFRHREIYFCQFEPDKQIDFTKANEDIAFTIKLIFDGLLIK